MDRHSKSGERFDDLLPSDLDLYQRSLQWSTLFDRCKEMRDDDERGLTLSEIEDQSEELEDKDMNESDDESQESVEVEDFEDNTESDDSEFDIKDTINQTMAVIEKRKNNWQKAGIDNIMDTFDSQKISEKVGNWLEQSNMYNNNAYKSDMTRKNFHCPYEPRTNYESDDSFQSVDTAKYILSNRKVTKTNFTKMTIKTYCYSKQSQIEMNGGKYRYVAGEDALEEVFARGHNFPSLMPFQNKKISRAMSERAYSSNKMNKYSKPIRRSHSSSPSHSSDISFRKHVKPQQNPQSCQKPPTRFRKRFNRRNRRESSSSSDEYVSPQKNPYAKATKQNTSQKDTTVASEISFRPESIFNSTEKSFTKVSPNFNAPQMTKNRSELKKRYDSHMSKLPSIEEQNIFIPSLNSTEKLCGNSSNMDPEQSSKKLYGLKKQNKSKKERQLPNIPEQYTTEENLTQHELCSVRNQQKEPQKGENHRILPNLSSENAKKTKQLYNNIGQPYINNQNVDVCISVSGSMSNDSIQYDEEERNLNNIPHAKENSISTIKCTKNNYKNEEFIQKISSSKQLPTNLVGEISDKGSNTITSKKKKPTKKIVLRVSSSESLNSSRSSAVYENCSVQTHVDVVKKDEKLKPIKGLVKTTSRKLLEAKIPKKTATKHIASTSTDLSNSSRSSVVSKNISEPNLDVSLNEQAQLSPVKGLNEIPAKKTSKVQPHVDVAKKDEKLKPIKGLVETTSRKLLEAKIPKKRATKRIASTSTDLSNSSRSSVISQNISEPNLDVSLKKQDELSPLKGLNDIPHKPKCITSTDFKNGIQVSNVLLKEQVEIVPHKTKQVKSEKKKPTKQILVSSSELLNSSRSSAVYENSSVQPHVDVVKKDEKLELIKGPVETKSRKLLEAKIPKKRATKRIASTSTDLSNSSRSSVISQNISEPNLVVSLKEQDELSPLKGLNEIPHKKITSINNVEPKMPKNIANKSIKSTDSLKSKRSIDVIIEREEFQPLNGYEDMPPKKTSNVQKPVKKTPRKRIRGSYTDSSNSSQSISVSKKKTSKLSPKDVIKKQEEKRDFDLNSDVNVSCMRKNAPNKNKLSLCSSVRVASNSNNTNLTNSENKSFSSNSTMLSSKSIIIYAPESSSHFTDITANGRVNLNEQRLKSVLGIEMAANVLKKVQNSFECDIAATSHLIYQKSESENEEDSDEDPVEMFSKRGRLIEIKKV